VAGAEPPQAAKAKAIVAVIKSLMLVLRMSVGTGSCSLRDKSQRTFLSDI
jgi:hypothetical protein